ncbi:MAG: P-loop NTPase [Rhodospirillales bacterium]
MTDRAPTPRPAPRTIADLAQAGLIIEDEGRTRLGDEFRICASRLHSAIKASILSGERNGNALMVTSTKPAEGKSFSSLNLAAALAQTAQRPVVLVDADLKPGSLSELMGLKRQPRRVRHGQRRLAPPGRAGGRDTATRPVDPAHRHAGDADGSRSPPAARWSRLCRRARRRPVRLHPGHRYRPHYCRPPIRASWRRPSRRS